MVLHTPAWLTRQEPQEKGARPLIPALLISSTVNAEGNIDLPDADAGGADAGARVEFFPGSEGEIYQRRYRSEPSTRFSRVVVERRAEAEALDMAFLARCLTRAFGANTPPVFRLAEPEGVRGSRFALPGEDRERLRILHNAFSLYLFAYEEHLV